MNIITLSTTTCLQTDCFVPQQRKTYKNEKKAAKPLLGKPVNLKCFAVYLILDINHQFLDL